MNGIELFIKKMPKVELHVHLEGSVKPETLLKLAEKNKVDLPYDTLEGLKDWYRFENFDGFIEVYLKICECIKTAEDITLIASEFLKGQAEQNIIYSEITWTPFTHLKQHGISIDEQAEALAEASVKAEEESGIHSRYIFDISRQESPEDGLVTAKWLAENANNGLTVALGLGGPEAEYPAEIHYESFKTVKDAGIYAVPHAGETAGPESIRSAFEQPGTARIGHGVRLVEDLELLEEVKRNGIVLEVCPTSNICLKVFSDYSKHSLPELIDKGIMVTINSDDPPMFNTTLTKEYQLIHEHYGYGVKDFYRFNRTALAVALCDNRTKLIISTDYENKWKESLKILEE